MNKKAKFKRGQTVFVIDYHVETWGCSECYPKYKHEVYQGKIERTIIDDGIKYEISGLSRKYSEDSIFLTEEECINDFIKERVNKINSYNKPLSAYSLKWIEQSLYELNTFRDKKNNYKVQFTLVKEDLRKGY